MFDTCAARVAKDARGGWKQPPGAQVGNPRRLSGLQMGRLVCHEEKLNGVAWGGKPNISDHRWAQGSCWRLMKRLMKWATDHFGRAL